MKSNFCFRIISVLISLILICITAGAQEIYLPYSNSHNLTVDSVRMHYRLWKPAKGSPRGKVAFVHGFCGSTYNFRNNIDTLVAAGYEVVALDLPGFGYSERRDDINQSQSNRARIVWSLLDSLSTGDTTGWNLVGHSMGGGTVEAMAMMHPDKTRTLTIIDGMLISKSSSFYQSFFSLNRSKKRNEILESITEKKLITYKNFEKKLKAVYGFEPDSVTINAYLKPLEITGSSGTIVNIITNAEEIAPLKKDSLNKVHILVVWGKKDKTIGIGNGKRFKKEFPATEFKVIPDAYHIPNETHPKIFNSILVGFLNSRNI